MRRASEYNPQSFDKLSSLKKHFLKFLIPQGMIKYVVMSPKQLRVGNEEHGEKSIFIGGEET